MNPNLTEQPLSLECVVNTLTSKKLFTLARKLATLLEYPPEWIDYKKRRYEQKKNFDLDKARQTAADVDDYIKIAKAEIKAGLNPQDSIQKAKQVVINVVINIEDIYLRAYSYIEIAEVEIKARLNPQDSLTKAKEDAKKLKGNTEKRNYIEGMIEICSINAKIAGGDFEGAKQQVPEMTHDVDRVDAYCSIAVAEAKAGKDYKQTFSVAKGIAARIEYPEEEKYKRGDLYRTIALSEACAGDFGEAKLTALTKIPSFNSSKTFADIAKLEAKAGLSPQDSFRLAVISADQFRLLPRYQAELYLKIIAAKLHAKTEMQDILDMLSQTKEIVDSIPPKHKHARAKLLLDIAVTEAGLGMDPEENLKKAEAIADGINLPSHKKSLYVNIMNASVKAAEILAKIPDTQID